MDKKLLSINDKRIANIETGNWNYPSMLANLQKLIFRPDKNDSSTTVVLMNIDNFARINEEWGQFSSNIVLAEFCQLILKHLRSSDLFGKWSEKEFILLLPDTNLTTGKQIAKRIGSAIEHKTVQPGWTNNGQPWRGDLSQGRNP